MSAAAVVLLGMLAVAGAAMADRDRRPGGQRGALLAVTVLTCGLLAAALLAAAAADWSAGWATGSAHVPSLTGPAAAVAIEAGVLAAALGGGPLAVFVLRLADPTSSHAPGPADPDLLGGGAWIGALERLAAICALLAGWPEGVVLVVAVKGLARYPELRRPAAPERFIIGTLASLLWAAGCAGVTLTLIR